MKSLYYTHMAPGQGIDPSGFVPVDHVTEVSPPAPGICVADLPGKPDGFDTWPLVRKMKYCDGATFTTRARPEDK
jgi:hypothetical protein